MVLVPLIIFALIISWCDANDCHFYTDELKSLKIFCEQTQHESPENCVQEIPSSNTTDVIRLKIEGCDQSFIGNASENFQHIQTLDISHSGYRSLNWTGNAFKNVTDLNVSFNELTSVPTSILGHFPRLESIDLSQNMIKRIFNADFKNVQNLLLINLSRNTLEFIDANAFHNLNKLSEVSLVHNNISTFPAALLKNSLQEVDIRENPHLSTINCTFIAAMRTKHVYISWKHITTFDGDEKCSELKFSLQSSDIDGIVPDNLNNILLRWNGESFTNVKYFVAGPRAFENVKPIFGLLAGPSVLKIDLSQAAHQLNEFNGTTFARFSNLRELNLSDTGLTTFNFNWLNHQKFLQHLDISANALDEVGKPILLQYLIHLVDFNAAGNRIQNAPDIIQHLPLSVQRLNLHSAWVGNVNANTFERLIALTHLKLSNANLNISDARPFKPLRQLVSLDVSHNDLNDVNFAMLEKLDQLKEFRASNCKLTNVSEIIQYGRPSMQILDVSGNLIGPTIDASTFHILNNLTHLNLSGTHLQQFDLETINPLKWLHTLDISKNQLQTIDLNALRNFTRLERLYLNGNDLTKLDCFALNASPNVSIAIGRNQFSCMYLKQLKRDSPMLRYIGDQLEQKHGENCRSSF